MSCTYILLALMSRCEIKQTSKGTLLIKQGTAGTRNLDTTGTYFHCFWECKLCSRFWTFIKVNSEISKTPPP